MKMTTKIDEPQVAQYVGAVSAAIDAAGYGPTRMFAEYVDLCDNPDYVVRATLAGGTVADLLWDTLCWKLIVYPRGGSNVHDDVLTGLLTDQADALPETVARLARPKLAEAARKWRSGAHDQAAEPDGEVVTFRWSATHGRCYECNRPAAFFLPRTYRKAGEPDDKVGEETRRCAVCAANAAAEGEVVRRIDAEPAEGAPAGGDDTGWIGTPEPARDEAAGVTFRPWTNGWAVGFRCERDNGDVEYVYLHPSTTDGESDSWPNVFAYVGAGGDPDAAHTAHFYDVFRQEGGREQA